MRERRAYGYLLSSVLLLTLAAPTCGGNGGSSFCGDWATAFCRKLTSCDPANAPPSEADCVRGFAMLCSQPQQAGQTFDVNCYGKQVNEAAKTACLNKLSTVTCDEFNSATYNDDCELVCTSGGTGGSGGSTGTGGAGGSGSCGTVAPCGGSIAATWSITGICATQTSMPNPQCAGGTLTITGVTETGTLSFAAGGTYTASVTGTISFTDTTPSTCISPATCADLGAAYVAQGASATCSGTTVCTCTVVLASSASEAGTYTTSGTTLTVTPSGGSTDSMGYCVQGDTLHLSHFNSAGQVTSAETAQRQ